jgi:hypothetical protein
MATHILEGKENETRADIPYYDNLRKKIGGHKGATHEDFLLHIRDKFGKERECHSDGFLAIPPWVPPSYECECGFNGVFRAEKCIRCGRSVK